MNRPPMPATTTTPSGWFSPTQMALYRSLAEGVPVEGHIVEVGVFLGRSLSSLVEVVPRRRLQVHAVDLWADSRLYKLTGDERYAEFVRWLSGTQMYQNTIPLRMASWQAARKMRDASVDLIHIDGCHEMKAVLLDLHAWVPKMKPGGVMLGHDYRGRHKGVALAVDAFFGKDRVQERAGMWIVRV